MRSLFDENLPRQLIPLPTIMKTSDALYPSRERLRGPRHTRAIVTRRRAYGVEQGRVDGAHKRGRRLPQASAPSSMGFTTLTPS